MSALSYYIEEAGVATTGISLVRPHSETMKPPRALWVPFELGHPLGSPDNPNFQSKVLLAALKLLEAPSGPLLVDFPEDAPESSDELIVPTCPVSYSQAEPRPPESPAGALRREMTGLRPWY